MLNLRDLQSHTSTSCLSSALTHTRPTSSPFSSPANRGTSPTLIVPNTPTFAAKPTAQHTTKCQSTYLTSCLPLPTTPQSPVKKMTSPDSSPSKNTSLPSPRLPLPTSLTTSSPQKMTHHHSTFPWQTRKLSKSFLPSPHTWQKYFSTPILTSMTPSTPSPLDLLPPSTAKCWLPAKNSTSPKSANNSCKPKSPLATSKSPNSKDNWEPLRSLWALNPTWGMCPTLSCSALANVSSHSLSGG